MAASGFLPGMTPGIRPVSIPSPDWSGFVIPVPWGQLSIRAYALCILLGIIAALWLTHVRWKRRGGPAGSLWDIAIWAIPFGIVGGRLYHVVTSPDAYFGPQYDGTGDLSRIFAIWEGGLGIWGAVALGVLGAWIGCRRAGVKLPALIDAAAPGLLLAQAIGRWGNYFNQELFGAPTELPWGLQINPANPSFPEGYPPDTVFHPTFLYESLWNLLGVVVLLLLDRKFRFQRGRLFALYVMYYSLGRTWIEMLRIDEAQLLTFFGVSARLNVWTSVLGFVAALVVFLVLTFTARNRGDREGVLLHADESKPSDILRDEGQAARPSNNSPVQNADTMVQSVDDPGKRANLTDSPSSSSTDAIEDATLESERDGKSRAD